MIAIFILLAYVQSPLVALPLALLIIRNSFHGLVPICRRAGLSCHTKLTVPHSTSNFAGTYIQAHQTTLLTTLWVLIWAWNFERTHVEVDIRERKGFAAR